MMSYRNIDGEIGAVQKDDLAGQDVLVPLSVEGSARSAGGAVALILLALVALLRRRFLIFPGLFPPAQPAEHLVTTLKNNQLRCTNFVDH